MTVERLKRKQKRAELHEVAAGTSDEGMHGEKTTKMRKFNTENDDNNPSVHAWLGELVVAINQFVTSSRVEIVGWETWKLPHGLVPWAVFRLCRFQSSLFIT